MVSWITLHPQACDMAGDPTALVYHVIPRLLRIQPCSSKNKFPAPPWWVGVQQLKPWVPQHRTPRAGSPSCGGTSAWWQGHSASRRPGTSRLCGSLCQQCKKRPGNRKPLKQPRVTKSPNNCWSLQWSRTTFFSKHWSGALYFTSFMQVSQLVNVCCM